MSESSEISLFRVFVGIISSVVVLAVGGTSTWVLMMAGQVSGHEQRILANTNDIGEIKQAAIREADAASAAAEKTNNIQVTQGQFRIDIDNIKEDLGDIKHQVGQVLEKLNEPEKRDRQ